jgi:F420-dependent oxidoreductase-like protein
MRLGVSLGYFTSARQLADGLALAEVAEELGYDCIWVAEAYGSDAPTVLSAIASRTRSIGIGSAVMQIPARSPAMTAMTAATLDALSGGRFRLGLGVSGPQVSEGWHGVHYGDPLGRTEEYVAIVRKAIARQRLTAPGPHFPLPLPDSAGKALGLSLDPVRRSIPVYLAAVGPKNLELTGRIADGWHGIFFDAEHGAEQVQAIRSAAAVAGRDPDGIDITVNAGAAMGPSVSEAARALRPNAALYLGGMGSRATNFYQRIAARMGFAAEAAVVQDKFLARDYAGAAASVPVEFLTRTSLLGTPLQIQDSLRRFAAAGITSVNVAPFASDVQDQREILAAVADALRDADLSEKNQ